MSAQAPGQLGQRLRTVEEIRAAYDAQADESFRKKLANPFFARYGSAVGKELAKLEPGSVLEVGCGDCYTLSHAIESLGRAFVFGVDISAERIGIGRAFIRSRRQNAEVQIANMFALPFPDDFVDVVFTSHAVEPNGGREVEAIRELYRVARKYLVLFEPDFDKASMEGRARMRRLGYVTCIPEAIREVGCRVEEYRAFEEIGNPLNPTSAWRLAK